MNLPEVTEIQRWTVRPGDCLVIRTDLPELSLEQAQDIRRQVRYAVGLDVPLLVLPRDWSAEVVNDKDVPVEER